MVRIEERRIGGSSKRRISSCRSSESVEWLNWNLSLISAVVTIADFLTLDMTERPGFMDLTLPDLPVGKVSG